MQQYVLGTICVVSKWEYCSEQNPQDPGGWERWTISKIDYKVVESIPEGKRTTNGFRKFPEREWFATLNCKHNQGSHHWKDNDWLKDRKRENQEGVWRKNFPERTASAKIWRREGGAWKLRSEAIALGQVIKNLEGLLGDLRPLLWTRQKTLGRFVQDSTWPGLLMVKSYHTGSCAEIGGPWRIGEVS